MDRHAVETRHEKYEIKIATHCAGDAQASPEAKMMVTIPKFVGLKICLWFHVRMNLLAMAMPAVATINIGF